MRYDTFADENQVHVGRILGLVLAVIVFFALVGGAIWGLGVALAPAAGKGNVHKQINAPNNIIFQYQHFFDLDANIKTQAQVIRNAEAAVKSFEARNPAGTPDPTGQISSQDTQLRGQVTGAQGLCTTNVNQYNADAREYTREQFLSNKLPAQEDPSTCQPSQ